jgi:hypothetical protein
MENEVKTVASTPQPSRLAAVLNVFVESYFWFVIVGLAGIIIMPILAQLTPGDFPLPFSLPMCFDMNTFGDQQRPLNEVEYMVANGSGEMVVMLTMKHAWLFIFTNYLAGIIISLAIAWLLRGFFRTIRRGKFFDTSNAQRLIWMGYIIAGGEVVKGWIGYAWSSHFVPLLKEPPISFKPDNSFKLELFFIGLIIVVIGHIYKLAVNLQREQELTI